MATDVLLIREGSHLAAADPISHDAIVAIKHGEYVTAKITRTRNPGHHRKWGAMMSLLFKNQDRYKTFEHFHLAVKQMLGFGDYVDTFDGRGKLFVPRSISFAKMGQAEFEQFYQEFESLVLMVMLPHVDCESFKRAVFDIMDGRRAA